MLVSGFPGRGYLSAATPMLVALCMCVNEDQQNPDRQHVALQRPISYDSQVQSETNKRNNLFL